MTYEGDPTFPPLLTGHRIGGGEAPLAVAVARATTGEIGAGDVLWSPDGQRGALAIVLEPECRLRTALQMAPLAQVAAGDCIGALTPPKVAVNFRWPREIVVNGGVGGELNVAWPAGCGPDEVPNWLVLGLTVALKYDAGDIEPGFDPERTVLAEEGCPDLTSARLISSYARHFLTWLNNWQDDGFRPVSEAWMFRADGIDDDLTYEMAGITETGRTLGLDEDAGLLLKRGADEGGAEPRARATIALSLLDALSRPLEVRAAGAGT